MIGLLQRVTESRVVAAGEVIAEITAGLLVFIGIERGDGQDQADRLLHKLLHYRVFPDAEGKMNRSLSESAGELLLVSQFTLAADTSKGLRPGFSSAAATEQAGPLFDYLLQQAKQQHGQVAAGRFAADMQVHLCNDGPVTFSLRIPPDNHSK